MKNKINVMDLVRRINDSERINNELLEKIEELMVEIGNRERELESLTGMGKETAWLRHLVEIVVINSTERK